MPPTTEPARFLEFKSVPHGTTRADGSLVLNRYSSILTNAHDYPGAQAMLYAAGVKNEDEMHNAPQVGMNNGPASHSCLLNALQAWLPCSGRGTHATCTVRIPLPFCAFRSAVAVSKDGG